MGALMEHKILFTGTTGVGKTTAIRTISQVATMLTEVKNNDPFVKKASTTVGLDYGEFTLCNGEKLRLYGTPGQGRFDFMWKILSHGALGLIILIDNSSSAPLVDLDTYLQGFAELIKETACVVGVVRMDIHPIPSISSFASHLETRGVLCPVIPVDVRDADQVFVLLDLLLLQLEVLGEMIEYAD